MRTLTFIPTVDRHSLSRSPSEDIQEKLSDLVEHIELTVGFGFNSVFVLT